MLHCGWPGEPNYATPRVCRAGNATTVLILNTCSKSQLARYWPVGYLQSVEELNSGPPKTNPSSGREEDLNPGPPDYCIQVRRPNAGPRFASWILWQMCSKASITLKHVLRVLEITNLNKYDKETAYLLWFHLSVTWLHPTMEEKEQFLYIYQETSENKSHPNNNIEQQETNKQHKKTSTLNKPLLPASAACDTKTKAWQLYLCSHSCEETPEITIGYF